MSDILVTSSTALGSAVVAESLNLVHNAIMQASDKSLAHRLERQMLCEAISSVSKLPFKGSDGSVWFELITEAAIGNIKPDAIAAYGTTAPTGPKKRLSWIQASLLSYLSRKPAQVTQIQNDLYLSDSGLATALQGALSAGYVVKTRNELFKTQFPFNDVYIVAFEFKLKRWREAFNQALAYRDFANEAYVVLDRHHLSNHREIEEMFSREKMGLIWQDGSTLQVGVESSVGYPRTPERVLAVQRVLGRY